MSFNDLTNQRFGLLTVISRAKNDKHGAAMWDCACDCGNHSIVRGASLKSGFTKSCGCLQKTIVSIRQTKHGQSHTRLFNIWQGMKRRCCNPNYKYYGYYGAKGIAICDEWLNCFQSFYDWAMKNGYADELTIDRIDPDGNYEPNNCRWTTRATQQNNRSSNHYYEINDETHSLAEWCRIYNVPHERTRYRVVIKGWNIIDALTTPAHH